MSGGFFRGTSADQDTRFSNKQAKLLKSQKFPPELDHLVDMTKVKMDVVRPWIATRVTELLGFDDEVLINFIFELLEGKEVDGKQIQIQLTGFMEKNTGKFMRELWGLLLSAQNNVSGVPQQFLDAKEEETRKKKEETDRIAGEIQKRRDRDGREPERARKSRFDGEADGSKFTKAPLDSVSKFSKPNESSVQPEEDREVDGWRASRAKNRHSRSPHPNDRSPSRISRSPTRSNNKSISRSRSHSEERQKSVSLSVSSQSPRHSVSPGRRDQSPERRSLSPKRRYRSPPKRSLSPRRRHSPGGARSPLRRRSPLLRRSPRSRHRSPSPFRYRSPPLARRRSPRRRSRSPLRRRSPSPLRRRSPPRLQRSPSPLRRRSPPMRRRSPPFRRRSPSPLRHRSPMKTRRRSPSPVRKRSHIQDRSASPVRGRSPSPLRRRSPPPRSPKNRRRSPLHSPKSRTADSPISPPQRKRSRSPYKSQSPAHRNRRSLSREHDSRANGNESGRYRDEQTPRRVDVKKSLVNHALERELAGRSGSKHKVPESLSRKSPISLRSPQRDVGNQSGSRKKMEVVLPENSPSQSDSPTDKCKVNPRTSRRSRSLSQTPLRQTNIRMTRHDSPATNKEDQHMTRAREVSHHRTESSCKRNKDSPRAVSPGSYSPDRRGFSHSPAASGRPLHPTLKKKDIRHESDIGLPERHAQQLTNSFEEIEYAPGKVRGERGSHGHIHDEQRPAKQLKADVSLDKRECNEQTVNDERRHRRGGDEYSELHHGTESITRSKKKMDKKSRLDTRDSDSEETNSYRNENMEKRRHKKYDKRKRDNGESSDSDFVIEDKKEAKRRRKDEKRLRKEEKRRRREERHRRKLERRAGKMKGKSIDTVSPPSDFDVDNNDAGDSDVCAGRRKNSHPSDAEAETEQKKLEIELREKALESLRAKKAFSH